MKIIDLLMTESNAMSVAATFRGCVASVGNFDGVHLGHRAIIDAMRVAACAGGPANQPNPIVAVTFEPHPMEMLRPESAPRRLTPWREKLRQLEATGVDAVVRLTSNAALLNLEPEAFVADVLVKHLRPTWIIEGSDFGFGRARRGNVELLQTLAGQHGYSVRIVPPVEIALSNGSKARVSSTQIREFVSQGEVDAAAAMLGRPYSLVGTVIHGAGAGATLGYPTMNLDVGNQAIPGEGVYAGRVEIDGQRYLAAISVGTRATMGGAAMAIEAFALDAAGDWYGREARLELNSRLRDQQKFANVAALTEQIGRDVAAVRELMPD